MNKIYYSIDKGQLKLFEDEICARVDSEINNTMGFGVIEFKGDAEFINIYSRQDYIDLLKERGKSYLYKDAWNEVIDLLEGREVKTEKWVKLKREVNE